MYLQPQTSVVWLFSSSQISIKFPSTLPTYSLALNTSAVLSTHPYHQPLRKGLVSPKNGAHIIISEKFAFLFPEEEGVFNFQKHMVQEAKKKKKRRRIEREREYKLSDSYYNTG